MMDARSLSTQRTRADRAFGAVLAVAGIAIARSSAALPAIPAQAYGPGFFPMWVGIGLAACGVLMAVRTFFQAPSNAAPTNDIAPVGSVSVRHVLAIVWMLVGLLLVALLLERVGFLLCMPVFMLVFLLLLGEPMRRSVLTTVVATSVVYWGFARLLKVPIPLGLLQGAF